MQEMNENAAVPTLGLVWRWEFTQRRQKKKKTYGRGIFTHEDGKERM